MEFCYAKFGSLLVQNSHKWLKRIENPAANLEQEATQKKQRRHRRRWFRTQGGKAHFTNLVRHKKEKINF